MKPHALFLLLALTACQSATDSGAASVTYASQVKGMLPESHSTAPPGCIRYFLIDGTITVYLKVAADNTVSGRVVVQATGNHAAVNNGTQCNSQAETRGEDFNATLSGTTSHMTASTSVTGTGMTESFALDGALSSDLTTLTTTVTFTHNGSIPTPSGTDVISGSMSGTVVLVRS